MWSSCKCIDYCRIAVCWGLILLNKCYTTGISWLLHPKKKKKELSPVQAAQLWLWQVRLSVIKMASVPSSFVYRLCFNYFWYLWLLTKCYSVLNWTHTYTQLLVLVYQCNTSTACVRLRPCVYMNMCAHVVPITLPLYVCVWLWGSFTSNLFTALCGAHLLLLPYHSEERAEHTHTHKHTHMHTHERTLARTHRQFQ